jgi:hypothetical protein
MALTGKLAFYVNRLKSIRGGGGSVDGRNGLKVILETGCELGSPG